MASEQLLHLNPTLYAGQGAPMLQDGTPALVPSGAVHVLPGLWFCLLCFGIISEQKIHRGLERQGLNLSKAEVLSKLQETRKEGQIDKCSRLPLTQIIAKASGHPSRYSLLSILKSSYFE